jgi:hypothetical protein
VDGLDGFAWEKEGKARKGRERRLTVMSVKRLMPAGEAAEGRRGESERRTGRDGNLGGFDEDGGDLVHGDRPATDGGWSG